MAAEIPSRNPENKEILDDNARKFITAPLGGAFLHEHQATSYLLVTDWLATGETTEKKLAYKEFENGDVQILLITKTTRDGSRTSVKEKIGKDEYAMLAPSSVLHLEKKRSEFEYTQSNVTFSMKYDEYADGKSPVLEVDASSEEERNAFSPNDFPSELTEVTGDIRYYGYHMAETK